MLTLRRWQTWQPFSADNFFLLCKKQKHLRCMEIGPTDNDLMYVIEQKSEFFKSLDQVHDLELYPTSLDSLEVSQRLLQSISGLDSLSIRSGFDTETESPSDLEDYNTQPGLLLKATGAALNSGSTDRNILHLAPPELKDKILR